MQLGIEAKTVHGGAQSLPKSLVKPTDGSEASALPCHPREWVFSDECRASVECRALGSAPLLADGCGLPILVPLPHVALALQYTNSQT